MRISLIRTPDSLTVSFEDGRSGTLQATAPQYSALLEAAKAKDVDRINSILFKGEMLKEIVKDTGRVKIEAGLITYDGVPANSYLTDRIIEMDNEGFDVTPMLKFLEKLMENPSYRAVNELYRFMEATDLPITDDGCFLAYKNISMDWKDLFTGEVDNSIGATPSMPRNQVDEDKDRTCSNGLHFCSREYLPMYGGSGSTRTIVVKVNPRDVVAIPKEYNNSKGRCCDYEVMSEISSEEYRPADAEPLEDVVFIDTKKALPGHKKEVMQINAETNLVIKTFPSVKEASDVTGTNDSSIRKVCNGSRNKAGGFKWEYVTESEDK